MPPQHAGQAPVIKQARALEELLAQGEFAELWRIQLQSATVQESLVLAGAHWEPASSISVDQRYQDGQWRVTIRRKLSGAVSRLGFGENDKYTFGVALNGATRPGGSHWVSLPMTFSVDGDETDFRVE